jgi:hypothetical protein
MTIATCDPPVELQSVPLLASGGGESPALRLVLAIPGMIDWLSEGRDALGANHARSPVRRRSPASLLRPTV